jgi:hypothetical protein
MYSVYSQCYSFVHVQRIWPRKPGLKRDTIVRDLPYKTNAVSAQALDGKYRGKEEEDRRGS